MLRQAGRRKMRWVDRALLLCTALVALVNVLPLGARLSWTLELTSHFFQEIGCG